MTVSFLVPVQEDIQAVEALMRSQAGGYHADLDAALELLISAGGKRIRPALTLLVGRMLGARHDSLISLAAAIEMLHTATLVHDDLIDGALLRRGMPTLNSRWSPGATVLTGDFVFARAAKMAADTRSTEVMSLFANTLTIIVDGEITQLLGSRCKVDHDHYIKRIYAKTASLFETSAKAPALLRGASAEDTEALRRYGYEIGMAFQIIDDILDFTGDQATIGKPVGSDLRQGIITLPAMRYAETNPTNRDAQALISGECLEDDDQLDQLIADIQKSDAIHQSHAEAVAYVERGLTSLRALPPGPERTSLEELGAYIVQREL